MKYFAYGSNMDQGQMRERCPESKLLGKAVLTDYAIAFTIFSPKRGCGCADILEEKGKEVWGLLYEVTDLDIESLDKAEMAPHKYKRIKVEVVDALQKRCVAETYQVTTKEGSFLLPSKHYLGLMKKAAQDFGFPQDYQGILAQTPTLD